MLRVKLEWNLREAANMTTRMLGRLRFVDLGKDDVLMKKAEQALRDRGVEPVWVSGDIKAEQVNRESIYVLENFDTPPFKLLARKCRLVGPGVVLAHLQRGLPLPAAMQPVFSLAMLNIVACFTQPGPREKRDQLCERVLLMAGKVQGDFTRHVTHLIAGQVGSTKYNVARQLGIPVVLPSWVEDCWERGLDDVVYAADEDVISCHRCPPLTGCTITVTGLDEAARKQVSELCRKHGGVYSGELVKDTCTHLLVGSKNSTKYKYARQWGVECVTPSWLHDSVACGYCMPEKDYDAELSPNTSRRPSGPQVEGQPDEGWVQELEEYQVPASSEACFLDGCKLYFSGFTEQQLEKLYRIVNIGGGARFSDITPGVSHVVMGKQLPSELATLNQLGHCPQVVSVRWLLASCHSGTREPEERHVCLHLQLHASPLQLPLKRGRPQGEEPAGLPSKRAVVDDARLLQVGQEESDLLNEYGAAQMPSGEGLFSGKSFSFSLCFSAQDMLTATRVVQSNGGKVVMGSSGDYHEGKVVVGSSGDYHIVPLELNGEVTPPSVQLVTTVWVERCIDSRHLLDPSSYFLFQPMPNPLSRSTLGGCVLALSQFSHLEREHLMRFCNSLGAVVQDAFVFHPSRSLMASTHLVLKEPDGDKYAIAMKWGIPAVQDSWLFACAKAQCIVCVDEYLIQPAKGAVEQALTGKNCISLGQEPVQKSVSADSTTPPTGSTAAKQAQQLEPSKPFQPAEPVKQVLSAGAASLEGPPLETPLKNFKPHFDIKPALDLLPSPMPGNNTQLAEMFEMNLAKALETATKAEQEANIRGEVLKGTVLCLSKKLTSYTELHSLACSLGAECRRYVDDSCTHYVCQSKGAGDKELKAAKDNGCHLVSPHWIFECDKAMTRADEALYPPTYNPSMALNISTQKLPAQGKEVSSENQRADEAGSPTRPPPPLEPTSLAKPLFQDPAHSQPLPAELPPAGPALHHRSSPAKPPPPDSTHHTTLVAMEEAGQRELKQELEELRHSVCGGDPKQRRKSRRLVQRGEGVGPPPLPSPGVRGRRTRRWRKDAMVDSQLSDSQVMTVVYDDPEGRKAKEKLLEAIEREEQLKAKGIDPRLLRSPPKGPDIQLILPPLSKELEERIFAGYVSPLQAKPMDTSLPHPVLLPITSALAKQVGPGAKEVPGEERGTTSAEEEGVLICGKTKALPRRAVAICPSDDRGVIDDLPAATPAPPSLNVPIVTHARPTNEAQPLFDESEVTRKLRRQPPKFLLSLLEPNEKTDYGALIQELHGEYMDVDYFTASCTHLVVGKASRTEKYLGACACGKWVLRKSYMEACRAAGRFVEEEPHEWGEKVGSVHLEPLECAPKKWRLALSKSNNGSRRSEGAFHGWKVLVCMEKKKLSGLKRLLEAGGAEVVLPASSSVPTKGLTHALINISYFPSDLVSLEDLVKEGVHCLKPEFITDYLSKGDDLDMESSYIPQVKSMLKR